VERSLEMLVALLGVMKAGGAYVPLEPTYPEERLRFMLEDSRPVVLLTQVHLRGLFRTMKGPIPVLDLTDDAAWANEPETNPKRLPVGLTDQNLSYVIYTSGSTGLPKGVMVEHAGVSNLLLWMAEEFEVNEKDSVLQKNAFNFDASVWEIFLPLIVGGRLVIVRPDGHRDPTHLVNLIVGQGVTIVHFIPSLLPFFLDAEQSASITSLRHAFCGGEALPVPLLHAFLDRFHLQMQQKVKLNNFYGPTETSIGSLNWPCSRTNLANAPIGQPIANTQVYILDAHGELAPKGVIGELYIGGAGVARGYLNRPELTAERFVVDPFAEKAGARMYKTGDMGRRLQDGNIEFVGRNDFQVKIRGYRIELGEIEARLANHGAIREAVVVTREDVPGEKRLIAYYTIAAGNEQDIGAEELHSHLVARLPEYMVPAAYVRLEKMPLTSSGKLDRKALPVPEGDAYATPRFEEPQGEIETILAEIWADLLHVDRVGRHDNFFALGGHSLLAIKLVNRLQRRALHMEVRGVFTTPTLAGLAASVDFQEKRVEIPANRIPPECEAITPEMLPLVKLTQEEIEGIVRGVPGGAGNVQDIYPLAPLQEGILFHYLMGGEGDPYLLGRVWTFDTRARLERYLKTIQAVIDRHDILRTGVVWEGLKEPVQVVWRKAVLQVEEVELDPEAEDAARQLHTRFDPRQYRIDVRQAPLLRIYVARDVAQGRWVMLELAHHLTGDHIMREVMKDEIQAHLLEQADRLPVPRPFRNLVAEARLGVGAQEHEDFFRRMLRDVEEPTAPFGLLDVRGDGTGINGSRLELDAVLARRLRERARKLGVTAASLCHLAWAQVLSRVSGREDVVFGTVLFGRMQGRAGADRAMGLFINTLPIRIRISQEGVEASVRQTHALLADLMRHEHASLALAQRCSAVAAPTPLFSALFNYRHIARAVEVPSSDAVEAWEGIKMLYVEERTNYPFALSVDDLGGGFILKAQTVASIEPMRVCEFMRKALEGLVEALERRPDTAVRSLDVLPEAERHLVVHEWNATGRDYPKPKCVHELFEEQVKRTPEAVAVLFENRELTYTELNRRANQLAHHLWRLGVKPEERVAICVEQGLEMIVGLLGVLKAGGVYVPLDPDYPEERLRYMLEDSDPALVLTQGHLRGLLGVNGERAGRRVVDLGAGEGEWSGQAETNLERAGTGLRGEHLAYVIYTSGSTGQPKGVMISQQNLVSATFARKLAYGQLGRFLLLSSISFDSSVAGVFGSLLHGGTLIIATRDVVRDPSRLNQEVQRLGVESLLCVPSLYRHFLEYPVRCEQKELSRVIVAGEVCPPDLVAKSAQQEPQVELFNEYGPTEGTVWATMHRCVHALPRPSVPIGRPIANTRIYILDKHGEPAPVGVIGELYVGGSGVARGYLNQPELTAQRFAVDPFTEEAGARMYKTGDLGRWLQDGNIEFVGRNDFQVKIRGYRIELGEIEAVLREQEGVKEAVVVVRGEEGGEKRLVGYYTCAEKFSDPKQNQSEQDNARAKMLRKILATKLPEYMVPALYIRLNALPLTPNGKLDRRALPAPESDRRSYGKPRSQEEDVLCHIFAELLRLEKVGRDEDFFALGGHSLLAVQLMSRVHTLLGIKIPIRAFFEGPTVVQLCALIRQDNPQSGVFNRVVALRPGGRLPPLFCLPPAGGLGWFGGLLDALHHERPLYTLQDARVAQDLPLPINVDSMAEEYLTLIQKIQPNGAYYLIGKSFGGLLAHAIACLLQARGQRVALVAILDAYPSQSQLSPDLFHEQSSQDIKKQPIDMRTNLQEVLGDYPDEVERILRLAERCSSLGSAYRPNRFYGDILLFRAFSRLSDINVKSDRWQPYVSGTIHVHDIACNHQEMAVRPHITAVGNLVEEYLSTYIEI
jgi:amino acid adenylation domain-containing protein